MSNLNQETFIGSYFFSDLTVCDELIKFFKTNQYLAKPGVTSHNLQEPDITIKDSLDLTITPDLFLNKEIKAYLEELGVACQKYKEKYPDVNDVCGYWGIAEPFNIQYYKPGAGYKKYHTERGSALPNVSRRHLVFMTYLNDVTDEGETEFKNQALKIKPEKGKTLIWPVDWTHTHRGIVSKTQEKYIVTGWYSFY